MTWLIIGIISGIALLFLPGQLGPVFRGRDNVANGNNWVFAGAAKTAKPIGIALILAVVLSTSFVLVGANEVGHLKKIYGAKNLPAGRIIATDGEKGFQAEVLPPGFHFRFLINIIYEVEKRDIFEVPEGQLAVLTAKDGLPLRQDQFIAGEWPPDAGEKMLDAAFFLTEGKGQRGPQLNVLPPGKYIINRYLWGDPRLFPIEEVAEGEVGVVKSNVGSASKEMISDKVPSLDTVLTTQLVKRGGRGIWDETLPPGKYYINPLAYKVIHVSTRMFSWSYVGGYKKRQVNLTVAEDGSIIQKEEVKDLPVPENAADSAIRVISKDSWPIPLELRVQGQIQPVHAPFLVASVGNIDEAANKVVTPVLRSELRNVTEKIPAIEFISKRSEIELDLEKAVIPEVGKLGVTILDIRLADPNVPPELMIAGAREDLADQLRKTFEEEKEAQKKRIETERARAEANQQAELMKAEIAKQASELYKLTQQNRGEADANYLIKVAEGQNAQKNVLGQNTVRELELARLMLQFAKDNPQLVKMPQVLVQGSTGGFEGAAAILGYSNLSTVLKASETDKQP